MESNINNQGKPASICKGIGGHQSAKMRNDEWLTPPEIIEALGLFDLDPCAPVCRPWNTARVHYTINDDGLSKQWFGDVWLNPPYGREIEQWMMRMVQHLSGVSLIFARTETRFFQRYVFNAADSILFLDGRLHFYTVTGMRAKANAGAPSVLIGYGERNVDRIADSGIKGKHIMIDAPAVIVVGISPSWYSVVSIAARQLGDAELQPIYEMVERIAPDKVAGNHHWKEKIRQQIQVFRKKKFQL